MIRFFLFGLKSPNCAIFIWESSDSASEPVQWIFDRNSGNSKKFRFGFLNGILVRVRWIGRKLDGVGGGRLPCVTRHMWTDENVLSPFLTWKRWKVSVEGLHENQCCGNQPNCLQIATMIKVRANEVLEWQSIQVGATHFPLCSVSWWSSPLGSNICGCLYWLPCAARRRWLDAKRWWQPLQDGMTKETPQKQRDVRAWALIATSSFNIERTHFARHQMSNKC